MLILTVFPGKFVKLSPYLDKPFPYFSQVNSVELSQDLTTAPYSTRVLTLIPKTKANTCFEKEQIFVYTKTFLTLEFILIMSIVHMMTQSTP